MLCYLLNKRGTALKLRCVSGMLWFEFHGMICFSVDISRSCVPIFFFFSLVYKNHFWLFET